MRSPIRLQDCSPGRCSLPQLPYTGRINTFFLFFPFSQSFSFSFILLGALIWAGSNNLPPSSLEAIPHLSLLREKTKLRGSRIDGNVSSYLSSSRLSYLNTTMMCVCVCARIVFIYPFLFVYCGLERWPTVYTHPPGSPPSAAPPSTQPVFVDR